MSISLGGPYLHRIYSLHFKVACVFPTLYQMTRPGTLALERGNAHVLVSEQVANLSTRSDTRVFRSLIGSAVQTPPLCRADILIMS